MGNAEKKKLAAALHNAEKAAKEQGQYDAEKMNLINPVKGMGTRLIDEVAFAWLAHLFKMAEAGRLELDGPTMMNVAWSNAQEFLEIRKTTMGLDDLPEEKDSVILKATDQL